MKVLNVMFVTERPILRASGLEPGTQLPLVGEEIEIEDRRYRVDSRIWSVNSLYLGVAIHVTELR